jgi:SAM-dependent methyltransferase
MTNVPPVDRTVVEVDEAAAVRTRYARRRGDDERYSILSAPVMYANHERQRAMIELFRSLRVNPPTTRLVEVGCGTGKNLLEFLRFDFQPEHLQGIELLDESAAQARSVVPNTLRIITGDAADPMCCAIPPASQDIVFQSTVFSSLLDDSFQERLAARMRSWLRPGGGILWYDFTVDNYLNADVRGVPVSRIRQLFPDGHLRFRRITLAPPIARLVTRVHPALYPFVNCSCLRTHVLAWIQTPD